ncbi:putative pyridoxal-dependent decarboxylase domain-containing protein 2 [Babylonia areolata]|uniref:putative pyridoxal-dependent decarboxylase domain-containing protein 2 n=1 Tax=Babylonia areolata TaxID=304850 RepID=UPI003FD2BBB2
MAASSPSEATAVPSSETTSDSASFTMHTDANSQSPVMINGHTDEQEESDAEQSMFKKMVNPMLLDLETKVAASSQIFDRTRCAPADRKQRVKRLLSAQFAEALHGKGELLDSILDKIEQLVFFREIEGTEEVQLQDPAIQMPEMSGVLKTSLVAHSLKAYLTTLPLLDQKRVATKLAADCQLWLSRLFRFENSSIMYHDDEREGLVRICRLALYHSYPKYATDGFDALYSRPPVIYLSSAARPGLGHYLCLQLGLPLSCICTVPCNTVFGASSKMDVAMLEKLIQDDQAAAKTPVILLAFAGTPVVGHVDNLQRLQEICKTHSMWLHVEGNNLATLTLFSVPTEVSSAKSGDSITVTPGTWLGVPGLPCVTLYKSSDDMLVQAAGLSAFSPSLKLSCLPHWMCLLTMGHEGIVQRLTHSCDLAKQLYDRLDPMTTIKQISRDKKEAANKKQYKTLMELLSKAINALLVFEMASPTVVFRYTEDAAGPGAIVAPYASRQDIEQEGNDDNIYYDALNIWLAESLQHSDPQVPVEAVEVEKEGVCVRYCPLETAQARGTTSEDMDHFVKSLISNLSVLNASTLQRKRFQTIVQSQHNLCLVRLDKWAGLGAVSYVPDMFVDKEELGEKDLVTVNNFNAEVVHQLKAKDAAFSMGQTEEGRVCVKFGLITRDTDVEELVQLVQSTGREVEESSKFLESMSELIRKGIEEANQELQKEHHNKLAQEGVLRQIPMVSSVLNWLSPIKEDTKGRSFNLTSGKISCTQDTYKLHVQVQEDGGAPTHAPSMPPQQGEGEGEEGQSSTTAGQVKAQLVSQTPPSSPATTTPPVAPIVGPGVISRGKSAGDSAGAQSAQTTTTTAAS